MNFAQIRFRIKKEEEKFNLYVYHEKMNEDYYLISFTDDIVKNKQPVAEICTIVLKSMLAGVDIFWKLAPDSIEFSNHEVQIDWEN